MADYPSFDYTMKEVRRAGAALAGSIDYSTVGARAKAEDTFRVAHGWRDSHFFPMRSAYLSLAYRMRQRSISGDLASRPKRMASIRRKLRETTIKLDQMNDIAGCRVILNDISGVHAITEAIREKFPHQLRQEWHHIQHPKDDGYRSHHLVFLFCPRTKEQSVFGGRRIEVQVRTRLQHSWATAVEAVSLFNGEDLKHHVGNTDWLRLFRLMSWEFAHVEKCPVGEGSPSRDERIVEIKSLNESLGAVGILDNIKAATSFAETYLSDRGKYFLLIYRPDHTVEIENFKDAMLASARLGVLERDIEAGLSDEKVVVVEVDRVDKLVRSYPNYFGDVSLFVNNLRRICEGDDAMEYTLTPQEVVAPAAREKPDPSLLVRRYRHWSDLEQ